MGVNTTLSLCWCIAVVPMLLQVSLGNYSRTYRIRYRGKHFHSRFRLEEKRKQKRLEREEQEKMVLHTFVL